MTVLLCFLSLQLGISVNLHVPHPALSHVQKCNTLQASPSLESHQGSHSLQEVPRLLSGFAWLPLLPSVFLQALSLRRYLLVPLILPMIVQSAPDILHALTFCSREKKNTAFDSVTLLFETVFSFFPSKPNTSNNTSEFKCFRTKKVQKELPGGELNPGQPCDRRLY